MSVRSDVSPVAVAEGERGVAVGGSVRGSVIVTGDNNTVEMRLGPCGALLRFVFRWDRPRRRRRRDRRDACPPRFENHVDRDDEVAALLPGDGSPRAVNVYGPAGIGKTHVLVEALNRSELGMRDGIVYLDGRDRDADDLLHAVVDELYPSPVKRRDQRIVRLLRRSRAVVALEDVDLAPGAAQRLVLGAPHCRVLVTSRSHASLDARPLPLAGLAPEHAAAIAEQELGRPLAAQERRAAESIARRLSGHPLVLRQAFSRARDEGGGRPLDELEAEPWLVAVSTAADRLAIMTPVQLRAARALAVHGDALLGDEHLRAVAGSDAVAAAAELEARHDATSNGRAHALVGVLAQALGEDDALAAETDRALEHFITWSEARAGDGEALLREGVALLALLERAHRAERWRDVVRLGRAIEGAYALGQRWEAWGRVLELVLEAARRCQDLEAEGWARHQRGTRFFALGRIDDALAALHEALALRERVGDRDGAAATRQNLRVVSGPTPTLYRLSHLSLTVVAIICALLIGAAGSAGAGIVGGGDDKPVTAELAIGIQGAGLVVSEDRSIDCADAACRQELAVDRELVLRAQPQQGWEFARWSGACSGRSTCRLSLGADTAVVALFTRVRDPRDLTVGVQGKGTVVSHPAGIACHAGDDCQATFTRSRRLELTAAAAPGHRFTGWSHDCDGTSRCVIDDNSRRSVVHARFVTDPHAVDLAVDLQGDGLGRVTSRESGIDCGQLCATSYRRGTRVVLSATAQRGSRFAGWTDPACTSTTPTTCTVTLEQSHRTSARFDRTAQPGGGPKPGFSGSSAGAPGDPSSPNASSSSYLLTLLVTGRGTVSSRPAGIDACAKQCSAAFAARQPVVLTARADKGSTFAGWSDPGCSGTDTTCTVTLDRNRDLTARFDVSPNPSSPNQRLPSQQPPSQQSPSQQSPNPSRRPPSVRIDAPSDGSKFTEGDKIRYAATASDPQDGQLPDNAIVWREDGKVIGSGPQITRSGAPVGTHKIEVTATNSEKRSASTSMSITVVAAKPPPPPGQPVPMRPVTPNRPPQVRITSPQNGAMFRPRREDSYTEGNHRVYYVDVAFTAEASDPDSNQQLAYRWTDSTNQGAAEKVSTELSPILRLRVDTGCLGIIPDQPGAGIPVTASHALTLAVSDGKETVTAQVSVDVQVTMICRPV